MLEAPPACRSFDPQLGGSSVFYSAPAAAVCLPCGVSSAWGALGAGWVPGRKQPLRLEPETQTHAGPEPMAQAVPRAQPRGLHPPQDWCLRPCSRTPSPREGVEGRAGVRPLCPRTGRRRAGR